MPQQLGLFRPAPRFPATSRPPRPQPYRIPVYRVELVRERSLAYDQPQFRRSADVARLLQTVLAGVDREHCLVVLLDRKNRLIGLNTVAIGSLNAAVVHPREVFKPAILANAATIIVVHNHPSGDPQPSQEDKLLTRKLILAGEALSIQLLDHVILGYERYYSFKDEGAL
jgi:DNA repair protein RadC